MAEILTSSNSNLYQRLTCIKTAWKHTQENVNRHFCLLIIINWLIFIWFAMYQALCQESTFHVFFYLTSRGPWRAVFSFAQDHSACKRRSLVLNSAWLQEPHHASSTCCWQFQTAPEFQQLNTMLFPYDLKKKVILWI